MGQRTKEERPLHTEPWRWAEGRLRVLTRVTIIASLKKLSEAGEDCRKTHPHGAGITNARPHKPGCQTSELTGMGSSTQKNVDSLARNDWL